VHSLCGPLRRAIDGIVPDRLDFCRQTCIHSAASRRPATTNAGEAEEQGVLLVGVLAVLPPGPRLDRAQYAPGLPQRQVAAEQQFDEDQAVGVTDPDVQRAPDECRTLIEQRARASAELALKHRQPWINQLGSPQASQMHVSIGRNWLRPSGRTESAGTFTTETSSASRQHCRPGGRSTQRSRCRKPGPHPAPSAEWRTHSRARAPIGAGVGSRAMRRRRCEGALA